MAYAYRDVRASYTGAKAAQERHDLMFRFFARPLSFPVAWGALRLGLTPNHVSWISLGLNLLGLGFLASGDRDLMMAGVAIVLIALVLDAADGNMARTSRQFSPFGEWLEGVGSYVLCAGFHLAGGVGAWLALAGGAPVTAWPPDSNSGALLVLLGAVAATSITLAILFGAKFSTVFPQVDRGLVVARFGGGFYGFLFTIGRNLSFASGLVLPLTLIGIALGRYEIVLGGFALLNAGMMVVVAARCAWLANRSSGTRSGPSTH